MADYPALIRPSGPIVNITDSHRLAAGGLVNASGDLSLEAPTGSAIDLRINATDIAIVSATGISMEIPGTLADPSISWNTTDGQTLGMAVHERTGPTDPNSWNVVTSYGASNDMSSFSVLDTIAVACHDGSAGHIFSYATIGTNYTSSQVGTYSVGAVVAFALDDAATPNNLAAFTLQTFVTDRTAATFESEIEYKLYTAGSTIHPMGLRGNGVLIFIDGDLTDGPSLGWGGSPNVGHDDSDIGFYREDQTTYGDLSVAQHIGAAWERRARFGQDEFYVYGNAAAAGGGCAIVSQSTYAHGDEATVGIVAFGGMDSASAQVIYGAIGGYCVDNTAGTLDGALVFQIKEDDDDVQYAVIFNQGLWGYTDGTSASFARIGTAFEGAAVPGVIGEVAFSGMDTAGTPNRRGYATIRCNATDVGMATFASQLEFRTTNGGTVGGTLRFTIEANGTLNVAGTANYEALVTHDDDIPNKAYVDAAAGGYWGRAGTVLSPATAGDTVRVGDGSRALPAYSFTNATDTGIHYDTSFGVGNEFLSLINDETSYFGVGIGRAWAWNLPATSYGTLSLAYLGAHGPAARIGQLTFTGLNTTTFFDYAIIDGYCDINTSGSEEGSLDFQVGIGTGSVASIMTLNKDGIELDAAGVRVSTILDEDTLSSDSDVALATQQSIKAYVDAQIGSETWIEAENLDVDTGTENVDTFNPTGDGGCVWHYTVKKDANLRTGTVQAIWDDSAGTVQYTETATPDIGDTSDLVVSVNMSGALGSVQFQATAASDDWQVKVLRSPLLEW